MEVVNKLIIIIISIMIISTSRRDDILNGSENNRLPTIAIPPTINERYEKNILQSKESDFIKKMKRAKSIMIAHKNRKQKNVLNSYFMDSSRKKKPSTIQSNKSSSVMISSPKHILAKEKQNFQQRFENFLFPPVHSSYQIYLNNSKKLKSRQMRVQPFLYDPVDIGAYLLQQTQKKHEMRYQCQNNPQNFTDNDEQQLRNLKQSVRYMDTQRERINQTQISENNRSLLKCIKSNLEPHSPYLRLSNKKKTSKYFRSLTEQNVAYEIKLKQKDDEKLGRWQFSKEQQNIVLQQDNNNH